MFFLLLFGREKREREKERKSNRMKKEKQGCEKGVEKIKLAGQIREAREVADE